MRSVLGISKNNVITGRRRFNKKDIRNLRDVSNGEFWVEWHGFTDGSQIQEVYGVTRMKPGNDVG